LTIITKELEMAKELGITKELGMAKELGNRWREDYVMHCRLYLVKY
jgi:hypothetical protein